MSSWDLVPGAKAPEGRPLTGRMVLAILIGFFGVIASVNAFMIYSALSTFSGEVEPHAYEHGLAYNRDIAAARAQAARGWSVDAEVARAAPGEARIIVRVRDAKGEAVTGAAFAATLASPVDKKQDARALLAETAPGRYEGSVAAPAGLRDLELTATVNGSEVFRSRSRRQID